MAFVSQTSVDDCFCDQARHICTRSIDLRGVLARERSTTMEREAAVSINHELATSEPRVCLWTTHRKHARGIHQDLGVGADRQVRFARWCDDEGFDLSCELIEILGFIVLDRYHHGFNRHWLTSSVVTNCHLCLTIGLDPSDGAVLAGIVEAGANLV